MPRPLTKAETRRLARAVHAALRHLSQAEKPMTQAQYARSRNLSRQYISKCLLTGIIRRAVVETDPGRRLIDPVVADREMEDNRPGQIRIDRL